ncbi:IS66 family insertion sequence element accessory protein TnpA [Sphingobacterium sp. GVS05A]
MLSMIADWQQSRKSKKAYCMENGINEATFYYS